VWPGSWHVFCTAESNTRNLASLMSSAVTDPLGLAASFPAATREDWLTLVASVLKGAAFDGKLVAKTDDGLRIEPLYERARQARPIAGRTAGAPWQILQRIDHPDPTAASDEARHELENGAGGLCVVFTGAIGARGYGLDPSEAAMQCLFDSSITDLGIAIEFDLGPQAQRAPRLLGELLARRGVAPERITIRFGIDPLGTLAVNGRAPRPWGAEAADFAALLQGLAEQGFRGPLAVADGRPIHDAGGSQAQELAFVLSCAVAYMRALEASGVALVDARRMIFFRLVADADQFLTMAKFRALRLLWGRVEEASGLKPEPAFVSAETAWRVMTRRDPWVNLLRTTVAAFAAGLGGANAVTVLPFTAALGLPDRFARRVARNAQLILIEESNLAKVADPAAGSGGVEALTDALCVAAWTQFQEIEAAGGLAAALEAGLIQAQVAKVRAVREIAIATRQDPVTGTSEFPDIAERPVAVLAVMPHPIGDGEPAAVSCPALSAHRLAEPFEQLRDASDRVLRETGARPKIFLANLGAVAAFSPRASFAKNFFASGGIEAVTNDGFATRPPLRSNAGGEEQTGPGSAAAVEASGTDLSALVTAFRQAGTRWVCLCSSDPIYAQEAKRTAQALAAAGATQIYLAGRPGQAEATLRQAGVSRFIYADCDALATLQAAYRHLQP
jgi:methylmalonyl-CoA mutase